MTAYPQPEIQVELASDSGNTMLPTSIAVQVAWDDGGQTDNYQAPVTFTPQSGSNTATDIYLMDVFAAPGAITSTGSHSWEAQVTVNGIPGGPIVRELNGVVMVVVNGTGSPFGTGWSLAGSDFLYLAGATQGTLGFWWVPGAGGSRYVYPTTSTSGSLPYSSNDFGQWAWNGSGSATTYTYTAVNGTKSTFTKSPSVQTNNIWLLNTVTDAHGCPASRNDCHFYPLNN